MVIIDLLDQAGYAFQSIEVPEPVAPIQIWGDMIFMIQKNGKFKDVPYNVIQDTGTHKL